MGRLILGGRFMYEGPDSELQEIFNYIKNIPPVSMENIREESKRFEFEVIEDYKRRGIIKPERFNYK